MAKHDIDELIKNVPHYSRFFRTDEYNEQAISKASLHPDLCRLQYVGQSKSGSKIPMLSIGDGENSILTFALPHPNEPIGAMLSHFLIDELIADEQLRKGRTWHIIPCIDPDGTRLNEGWFDGPFTIHNYAKHFYRTKGTDQAEWTFPISYKNFTFDAPIPETKALMNAIEITKPAVMYSLHNAGFGGAYYYITEPLEEVYGDFHRLPLERGLALSLGEPEAPYCEEFHPAIYRVTSVKDAYDYYEKYGEGDPSRHMFGGASSKDYASRISNTFSLVTEVPYFRTKKIGDTTQIDATRGEVLAEGSKRSREFLQFVADIISNTSDLIEEGPVLKDASMEFVSLLLENLEGQENWIRNDEAMKQKATVAQRADGVYIKLFYHMLVASMYRRSMKMQLEKADNSVIRREYEKLDARINEIATEIGETLEYETMPIRDMVQIQYGALLAVLNAKNV